MDKQLEFSIQKVYANLRKSEKKTADYLLKYAGSYRELTLERVAEEACVSQPTVLRFIKALGYKGFREFRYILAKEEEEVQESNHFLYGFQISESDRITDVPAKVIGTSIEQMKETLKSISAVTLEKAVRMITEADKVVVYYVENSSCTASDLVTKLMYLGINCCVYNDYYMQSVSAENLTDADLAIGITYSGCSKSTVDAMRLAKRAGAKTIAITNFENSLIQRCADIVLATSNRQFIYGDTIFSRVSQLAVVDMIYTGILLSDYKKYTKILDRSSHVIKKQAYENL
jgi:DNA-binding MurR/RpiR family transcriptional regulator